MCYLNLPHCHHFTSEGHEAHGSEGGSFPQQEGICLCQKLTRYPGLEPPQTGQGKGEPRIEQKVEAGLWGWAKESTDGTDSQ